MTEYYPNETSNGEHIKIIKAFEGIPVFLSLDGSSELKPNDPQVGTITNVKIIDNRVVGNIEIENDETEKKLKEMMERKTTYPVQEQSWNDD